MDAVITYVNGMEPTWRLQYNLHVGGNALRINKFTDYGTLKYVLRGISEHMKFIDRVFLIVSSPEQVPDYVNDNVIIVTHDMFVPQQFLPTFNGNTLETFLWNIPDLSEEFIYFNDDMIPVNYMEKEDFFENGIPCLFFNKNKTNSYGFNNLLLFGSFWASKVCNSSEKCEFLWTQHIMTPFLKSKYSEAYNLLDEDVINSTTTQLREDSQITQYYFSDVLFFQNNFIEKKLPYKYLKTNITSNEFLSEMQNITNEKVICINDYGTIHSLTLKETKNLICDELNKILPNTGKYDK